MTRSDRVYVVSEHAIRRFMHRVAVQAGHVTRGQALRVIVGTAYKGDKIEHYVRGQEYRKGRFREVEFLVYSRPMKDNEGWLVATVLGPNEDRILAHQDEEE